MPETKSKSKKMSVRSAGIVLYRGVRPYKYLLLKSQFPPYHWSLPKGRQKNNETEIEAAVRETEEETGYNLRDYELSDLFIRELSYIAHGRNKTVVAYMAKLTANKPPSLSREHKAFKWVTLEEACMLFERMEFRDLYRAADAHLAMNESSGEGKESEDHFSNTPLSGRDSKSKGKSKH